MSFIVQNLRQALRPILQPVMVQPMMLQPLVLKSVLHKFLTQAGRLTAIVGLVMSCALLTGCVDYNLGIQFESPNAGQLTHRIRLENNTNPTAQAFLQQVRQQSDRVQGSFRSISPQESMVTIPFHTATELEQSFNRFFQTDQGDVAASALPSVVSHITIDQGNWLLFEHDRLTFDVDLSAFGLQGTESFADPGTLFNLTMAVNNRTWDLDSGKKNHIVTDLWMPMPLGWGTVAIGLLVGLGLRKRATSL